MAILISCQTVHQASHKSDEAIRILSYNIRNSKGMDGVTDYNRTATVINSIAPQVAAIQEIDSVTHRSKGVYVLQELAKRTNMYATFNPSISYDGGKYGIGILSKEKPLTTKVVALPGREEQRSLLIAEFSRYVVCCTHLSLTAEDRMASLSLINRNTKPYSKPVFLVGDFNAEPNSEFIMALSKSWTMLSDSKQLTFPSSKPDRCIDYIMVKPAVTVKLVKTEVIADSITSDHRPLYVDVTL